MYIASNIDRRQNANEQNKKLAQLYPLVLSMDHAKHATGHAKIRLENAKNARDAMAAVVTVMRSPNKANIRNRMEEQWEALQDVILKDPVSAFQVIKDESGPLIDDLKTRLAARIYQTIQQLFEQFNLQIQHLSALLSTRVDDGVKTAAKAAFAEQVAYMQDAVACWSQYHAEKNWVQDLDEYLQRVAEETFLTPIDKIAAEGQLDIDLENLAINQVSLHPRDITISVEEGEQQRQTRLYTHVVRFDKENPSEFRILQLHGQGDNAWEEHGFSSLGAAYSITVKDVTNMYKPLAENEAFIARLSELVDLNPSSGLMDWLTSASTVRAIKTVGKVALAAIGLGVLAFGAGAFGSIFAPNAAVAVVPTGAAAAPVGSSGAALGSGAAAGPLVPVGFFGAAGPLVPVGQSGAVAGNFVPATCPAYGFSPMLGSVDERSIMSSVNWFDMSDVSGLPAFQVSTGFGQGAADAAATTTFDLGGVPATAPEVFDTAASGAATQVSTLLYGAAINGLQSTYGFCSLMPVALP